MSRRNSRHKGYSPPIDRLGKSRAVVWVVAADHWGRVREARRLDPDTDLFDVLLSEALRFHRAGWELTDRPFFLSEFYVRRGGENQLRVFFTGRNPELEPVEAVGRYERSGFYAQFPKVSAYS